MDRVGQGRVWAQARVVLPGLLEPLVALLSKKEQARAASPVSSSGGRGPSAEAAPGLEEPRKVVSA